MKNEVSHSECPNCEYSNVCFTLLKFLHRFFRVCKQGRKATVRVKAKDQRTLPEVIDKDLIS